MAAKTRADIEAIAQVQAAAEAAMTAVIEYLRDSSQPSSEVAHEIIDTVLLSRQCESPDGHIVAGGKQSFSPHEQGYGLLLPGEPIVIDIYPRSLVNSWWGDMSRTVCLQEPSSELLRMYETVREAKRMVIALVKPGISGRVLHETVVDYFISQGYETRGQGAEFKYHEGFVHSLGHGVGKLIHEAPRLSAGSEDLLVVGDVITIEPALYYEHIGGVRLEDLLVVTENGAENFNHFPELLVL